VCILAEAQQNKMEQKLRQKIKKAIEKGDLNERDWDKEPLPKYFLLIFFFTFR
jgi:hypothetical protein